MSKKSGDFKGLRNLASEISFDVDDWQGILKRMPYAFEKNSWHVNGHYNFNPSSICLFCIHGKGNPRY